MCKLARPFCRPRPQRKAILSQGQWAVLIGALMAAAVIISTALDIIP